MSLPRFPFPRQKPNPAPEVTANPEPKGGRFKVTITPHLRGHNREWWAKVDDNGEQGPTTPTTTKVRPNGSLVKSSKASSRENRMRSRQASSSR
jgi:hypothetical protein